MKIYESGQMYLESIFLLRKNNPNVRSIDIAAFTGYSKPSVSRAVGLLKNANLIEISKEGYITLLPEGEKIAISMYERHTLLTEFFLRIGVSKKIASEDACKIEHVISSESFEALKNYYNDVLNKY